METQSKYLALREQQISGKEVWEKIIFGETLQI